MRILVTGANGFVGPYLCQELQANGHEVVGVSLGHGSTHLSCALRDQDKVADLVKDVRPHGIVHLAGISDVKAAVENYTLVSDVNIMGTYNLCRAAAEVGNQIFLYVSTGLVHGELSSPNNTVTETSPINILDPYAATKLAGEEVVRAFTRGGKINGYVVRPLNHIGPGQSDRFVVPSLVKRIKISTGTIEVGNLQARRDFSDVRDIVRAYRLILEKKPRDRLFLLGSGKSRSIQQVCDKLIEISSKKIDVIEQRGFAGHSSAKDLVANSSLAKKSIGWEPEIGFNDTLKQVFEAY